MGILYVDVFTLLVCCTIINALFTVVINAESTEYVLDNLRTSVDNIETTVDDIMSITEELKLLDNIDRKLNLVETLTKYAYILSKTVISYVDFNYRESFKEIKIAGLKINNLCSKIFTVTQNIRLNPGSLPENSEVILFSTQEIITLIHHLNTLLLKEESQNSIYDINKEPVNRKLGDSKRYVPNIDIKHEMHEEGKRVTFKDSVTVYEYNEKAAVSDTSPTERKCTLNDETQGYCLKEEILLEDISHDVCKSSMQPSLKSSSSYEKLGFDSCVNWKDIEEGQYTLNTNEDGFCELTESVKCASGTKRGAYSNLETGINSKAMTEKHVSNEILFTADHLNTHKAGNYCPQEKQVNPSEKLSLYESCTNKEICYVSKNKEDCKHTELYFTDEASCNSHECGEEFTAPSEVSSSVDTNTIPTYFEESTTTENSIVPDSVDSNENIKDEYSFAETAIPTSEQPPILDTFEYSEQSMTVEEYTTIETYTNAYDDTTTTESSPVYNDYGYSSDYTSAGETVTTESYSYSYDTFTTEQPSHYGSDSYTESTTTEQIETTTERDLSTLSQNIYSVAQDLSTKAQEISSVTSEISNKVSEISSALSDISTDDQDTQNKIQELSKLTQQMSSKTSEISTLSSETSRLASDISTASNDIPNVNNKDHPHRISPRQRIASKSQDLITSTQNIITAAQDVIVKVQDVSFRSFDLSKADMISTASHDITSRTQGIITDALDIVTAALEIMTSVDF